MREITRPQYCTIFFGGEIQGDQKVSVHLMILIQKSGEQRLFDHHVYVRTHRSNLIEFSGHRLCHNIRRVLWNKTSFLNFSNLLFPLWFYYNLKKKNLSYVYGREWRGLVCLLCRLLGVMKWRHTQYICWRNTLLQTTPLLLTLTQLFYCDEIYFHK